jgi:hypothetical protein
MLDFVLRVQKNTEEEIKIGHKVSFSIPRAVDAISVTANAKGFTPLSAAFRALYLDFRDYENEIRKCKKEDLVIDLMAHKDGMPQIILVPPTRGDTSKNKAYEYYASRIIGICNAHSSRELHFTHYGFINGSFQWEEIHRLLLVFLNPLIHTTLTKMYFEIDARYEKELKQIFDYIAYGIFRSNVRRTVIFAPEYEFRNVTDGGDSSWAELKRKDPQSADQQFADSRTKPDSMSERL